MFGENSLQEWLGGRLKQLQADRSNFNATWDRIARVILPTSVNFNTTNAPGTNLNSDIFDSTGQLALPRYAAALDTLVTPQTSRWHNLVPADKKLKQSRATRLFCDDATDKLFSARYAPRANFASRASEVYTSQGAFGQGVLYIWDRRPGLGYLSVHLSEIWFDQDANGLIDTAFWVFELTARQAVDKWRNEPNAKVPEDIVKEAKKANGSPRKYKFCKAVYPRHQRDPRQRDKKNMVFASTEFLFEGKFDIILEGGYRTFPFAIARGPTAPREIYARSVAQDALADMLTLQEMAKTSLRYGQLVTDPVWMAADADDLDPFSVRPGAVNYGYLSADGTDRVKPLRPQGDPQFSLELMDQRRQAVNTAFLVNLFQVLAESGSDRKTATEVMERVREKGALIAPIGGRLRTEFLGPMIDREIDILAHAGVIDMDAVPEELARAGGEIDVEYDSPLTRAMRAEEGTGILRTLDLVNSIAPQLASADQATAAALVRKVNWMRAVERLADINGAPTDIFNEDQDVEQAATGDSQAELLKSAIGAAPQLGKAAKDFAQAGAVAQNAPVAGATPGLI